MSFEKYVRVYCPIPDRFFLGGLGVVMFVFILFVIKKILKFLKMKVLANKQLSRDLLYYL